MRQEKQGGSQSQSGNRNQDDNVLWTHDPKKDKGKKPSFFVMALFVCAAYVMTAYGSEIVKRGGGHVYEAESTAQSAAAESASQSGETESTAESGAADTQAEAADGEAQGTSIANPWHEFRTCAEAESEAGFSFAVPGQVCALTPRVYRVIPREIFEVIYGGDGTDEIRLRKSVGTADNTGDYNSYPDDRTREIAGVEARVRSDQSGVHALSWNDGAFAYSITSRDGIGENEAEQALTEVTQGVAAEDEAISGGGLLTDPATGESFSDRVILVSVDQGMTESGMDQLCRKYALSVVYQYDSFRMYALSAGKALTVQELSDLISAVSAEEHVLSVSRDNVLSLDTGTAASAG